MPTHQANPKLKKPEDAAPSFSPEFFSVQLLPVATATGALTAVFMAGAPGRNPSIGGFFSSLQAVTPVSLSVWTASVVMFAIVLRPVSRAVFDLLTSGLPVNRGLTETADEDREDTSGWTLPLVRAVDEGFVKNVQWYSQTGLEVLELRALLSSEDQSILDEDRFSWEGATRMAGTLGVAAAIAGVAIWGHWDSFAVVVVPLVVLAIRYYFLAVGGVRSAQENIDACYATVTAVGAAGEKAPQK